MFIHVVQVPWVHDLQVELQLPVAVALLLALLALLMEILYLLSKQLELQEGGLWSLGRPDEVMLGWKWERNGVALSLGPRALLLEIAKQDALARVHRFKDVIRRVTRALGGIWLGLDVVEAKIVG